MKSWSRARQRVVRVGAVIAVGAAMQQRMFAQAPSRPGSPFDQTAPSIRRVVINIPAMTLEVFENDERLKSFPTAVGKPSTPTPIGDFSIATKVVEPTWYGPDRVELPGPRNPVGSRWIGLSEKGYGIHGTNAPRSIGRAASHGCIRMRNQDVEELFELVRVGDRVEIIYDTEPAGAKPVPDVYGFRRDPAVVTVVGGGR